MLKELMVFVCLTGIIIHAKDSEVTKLMKKFKIIPDVINEGPTDLLKVTFDSGVMVNKGKELKPTQVQNVPKVDWQAEKGSFYTLVLTDPDAPSRAKPELREWHHWLVVNIPGNKVNEGEELTQYVGSAPPKESGLHRYIYLLYKQPEKLTFDESRLGYKSIVGRGNFSTKNFAKKYRLGAPIAGNFYQAQWDKNVTKFY